MRISYINLALLLVIVVGSMANLLYGDFHGDATNFTRYYEYIDQGIRNDIYLTGQLNTLFITFIYGFLGPISPFIVNSSFLFIFWKSLNLLKLFKIKSSLGTFEKKKYLEILALFFLLIFNPSIYLRFLEPSREFTQLLFSLLLGISLATKSSNILRFFFACILILGRPVFTLIFVINFLICKYIAETGFKFNQKKLLFSFALFTLIVLISSFLKDLLGNLSLTQDINRIYTDLSDNYLGVSRNFLSNMILNIFGGINSFLRVGDIYTRIFYLMDYVNRILIFIISYRVFKNNFLLFLISGSLVLTIFTNFPHPRYFQPSYYFAIGYFSSYYLSKINSNQQNS